MGKQRGIEELFFREVKNMEIKHRAYSENNSDGPAEPKVQHRDLHRITSTAIIIKQPESGFDEGTGLGTGDGGGKYR